MFDVQRTAIRQGEQAMKQGLAAQRSVNRMALAGIKGQESLQRQSLELAQAATNAYVGTSMAMMGGGPGGRTISERGPGIDETFAQVKDTHSQFFDAIERELDRGVDSFDELSEDFVRSLDQQTEQLLEAYRTIEDQSTQNVGEFSQQLREQLERTQEMQRELETQFERQADQAEQLLQQQREQAERFQRQIEDEAARMQRQLQSRAEAGQQRQSAGGQRRAQSEARGRTRTEQQEPSRGDREASGTEGEQEERGEGESETEPEHHLERIDGLGPTFRERLGEAGIRTADDLGNADADTVAEAADVSRERAEDWIEQAGEE